MLETVVTNLRVTNHLDNLPPVQCRVSLTSTLSSFSLAYTIVLSRGLIDVLPDTVAGAKDDSLDAFVIGGFVANRSEVLSPGGTG